MHSQRYSTPSRVVKIEVARTAPLWVALVATWRKGLQRVERTDRRHAVDTAVHPCVAAIVRLGLNTALDIISTRSALDCLHFKKEQESNDAKIGSELGQATDNLKRATRRRLHTDQFHVNRRTVRLRGERRTACDLKSRSHN